MAPTRTFGFCHLGANEMDLYLQTSSQSIVITFEWVMAESLLTQSTTEV